MRPHRLGITFASLLGLVACVQTDALSPLSSENQLTAPGIDTKSKSVDGLTVGHRLLDAGEYELALKAYYRAAANQGMTVDTLSAIGSANLRLGRLGQAEEQLRMAIKEDATFVPAWNNLGVVLMETGKYGEAERIFRQAFALNSGESTEILANLRLALAKLENPSYTAPASKDYVLMRGGTSEYSLLPIEPL